MSEPARIGRRGFLGLAGATAGALAAGGLAGAAIEHAQQGSSTPAPTSTTIRLSTTSILYRRELLPSERTSDAISSVA